MILDKRIIVAIVLLVLILGSMESRPRALILSIATPDDAPLPYNDGPLGISILSEKLVEEGFEVVIIPEPEDLERYLFSREASDERIIVTIIGSDSLVNKSSLAETLRIVAEASSTSKISLVYADERPLLPLDSKEWMLVQEELCGIHYFSLWSMEASESNIVSVMGGEYVALTGYVAPLVLSQSGGVAYAAEPPDETDIVFMYAWPSLGEVRGLWFSLGGVCSLGDDVLVVIGDSTMFLNYIVEVGDESLDAAVQPFILASAGERGKVVFIQDLYISGEQRRNIAVMLAPSIIVLAVAELYRSLEPSIANFLASTPLAPAFIASVSVFLWATLNLFTRKRITGRG